MKLLDNDKSKLRKSIYKDLNGSKYFSDHRFSPELANLVFKFRTRMYNVRNNFRNCYKNSDVSCPVCNTGDLDTQEHLFVYLFV